MAIVLLEIQQLKIIDDIEYYVCNIHCVFPNVICYKVSIILYNFTLNASSKIDYFDYFCNCLDM